MDFHEVLQCVSRIGVLTYDDYLKIAFTAPDLFEMVKHVIRMEPIHVDDAKRTGVIVCGNLFTGTERSVNILPNQKASHFVTSYFHNRVMDFVSYEQTVGGLTLKYIYPNVPTVKNVILIYKDSLDDAMSGTASPISYRVTRVNNGIELPELNGLAKHPSMFWYGKGREHRVYINNPFADPANPTDQEWELLRLHKIARSYL